jgi:hypothetical protein
VFKIADSLVLANMIQLMMGDNGPVKSIIPGLENTTFALDDQNNTYSLGAPQPTVDILASLITDGERPQGRRASNRTLSVPIAILSDTRDNLSYAREMVFSLADQEQFTLRYTRDGSTVGPMVLDCWRAEPADVTYEPLVEQQFACQLVLNFEALPYGHADSPNSISFKSPAAGSNPPPGPIQIDGFSSVASGQSSPWQTSPVSISGNNSIFAVPGGNISTPFYQVNFEQALDLTTGGAGLNNVFQFWCGFASQRYYDNWANHRSEMTFSVKLLDASGNVCNGMFHTTLDHSNDLSHPKWTHISCRMPTTDIEFDYAHCIGYSIRCHNYIDTKGNFYLKDSTVYLDNAVVVSPSSSVANVTRGSIYLLNGIEGSVHTAINITATQAPSTGSTTDTFAGTGLGGYIPKPGVLSADITAIAPGGPSGPSAADNGGGGGGERIFWPGVPLSPGIPYTLSSPVAAFPLGTSPFAGTVTACGTYNSTGSVTSVSQLFSAAVAAGNTVLIQLVFPEEPQALSGTVTVADDAGNGNYVWVANAEAPDGTFMALYASFNIQHAIATTNHFTVVDTPSQLGASVYAHYMPGFLSCFPSAQNSGSSENTYVSSGGWLDSAHSEVSSSATDPTWWTTAGCTLTNTATPPANGVSTNALAMTSTAASGTASITSGLTPTNDSTILLHDMLANFAIGSSRAVTVTVTWYSAAQASLGTASYTVTLTANTWQWAYALSGWATSLTPVSTSAFVNYQIAWTPTAIGDTLNIQASGFKYASNDNPVYVAIVGNNSGLNVAAAPPGWTHIQAANNGAELSFDTYFISTKGQGGAIFGNPLMYASSIPWAATIFKLSDSAGWAGVVGTDGTSVIAHGGQPGSTSSKVGGLGGSGGNAPTHSPGGNGATGVTVGGGGGSSGGNSTISSFDDTSSNFTWWAASAPPVQITSDWGPASYANYVGTQYYPGFHYGGSYNNVSINGLIVSDPQMTQNDTLLVVVIADYSGSTVTLDDSEGNAYKLLYKVPVAGTAWQAQVFYCNASTNGGHVVPLTTSDQIWVDQNSTENVDYAIMAYIFKSASVVQGTGHAVNGEVDGTFTGTTGSATLSGLTTPPNGHFGVAIATDGVLTTLGSTDARRHQLGNAQYPKRIPSGDLAFGNWPSGTPVMQAFWKDADSQGTATSTALAFSRPTSGAVAYLFTTLHADTTAWVTGVNANYRSGTSHLTTVAGKRTTLTITSAGQIQITGKKGPDQGIMLVSVDNGAWQVVDNYRSSAAYQTVLFDTGPITTGAHVIDIATTGLHNPSSTNCTIDLDGYNTVASGPGAGANGSGSTGGTAPAGGGSGGNGATSAGAGVAGGSPGGGGGGPDTSGAGAKGGAASVSLTYSGVQPAFKTLVLHRPFIDGSRTLLPYIACQSQVPPTADQVQGIYPNVPPHFDGTYSFVVVASTVNSPSASRTWTVTVSEYEDNPGGVLPTATATSSVARTFTPTDPAPLGAPNNMCTVGEMTLPNKDIPSDNIRAVYVVSATSSNTSDRFQDIIMLDTMGQTILVNEATLSYPLYFVDEPTPDADIGRILGSQFDRSYAVSVLDSAFPTGGPLTVEPGDNVLFAYCVEGAPALVATYFPRYFIDKTVS